MILKVIMTYDVDETSGEIKYIGKEEVTVDTATKTKPLMKKVEVPSEPLLILEGNKYTLTPKATELLGIKPGDQVHINYPNRNGIYRPAIASSETLGVKAGNKLTKSLTVSYKGSANARLSEFGNEFKLEPSENEGVFWLTNDKTEVPKETIQIDEEFELDSLDDINLDQSEDKTDITFNLAL